MQAKKLKPNIDKIQPKAKWHFDLDNCDKILRIDCEEDIVSKIIDLLNNYKFHFEELK
jgi:hypothetical protein